MVLSSASVVQYGRRKGSAKNTSINVKDEKMPPVQAPDLRQVTVVPKAEWLRIQDGLNHVDKQNESLKEASKQREILHLRSQEVVKFWPNTIAGKRQKDLEAKKLQKEMEEKEREQIDLEEAKYQQEKRKEAIEKSRMQQYYQTDSVKGLHCALLLSEVLKEREAQLELKLHQLDTRRNADRDTAAQLQSQDQEALERDQRDAKQKRQKNKLIAEGLKQQITEHELIKEQEMLERTREKEELQRLQDLYSLERSRQEQRQREEKKNTMKTHMEHLAKQDVIGAINKQKEEMEEERRRLFASAKEKMMKLRNEKEAEMFREVQSYKEKILEKLAARKQEQVIDEEERITKAVDQKEARLAKEQKERDEKKAAMLDAITSHREAMRQQREEKEREDEQKALEMLFAQKEADREFREKQQLKAQKMKDDCKALQDIHIQQMAERHAKEKLLQKEQMEFDIKNMELLAMQERQFQTYAQGMISAAAETKRKAYPLQKAARQDGRGRLGPILGEPRFLVHDETGVQLPAFVSDTTRVIKGLHATEDIQQSKKRLGFAW
ncbi:cilia- and flagella- associated protein 210 [Paramormyrops kingsleyae]|uniref:Cilia and flagella associated protein 210 n=1 Tax=Paramormyrops kingsleyae TaxID=1676925 RepID=A0A3B3RIV2_9TELE|nr:coiled-coil domain-containing protein 173 [Paramormyrops kingsleyae]